MTNHNNDLSSIQFSFCRLLRAFWVLPVLLLGACGGDSGPEVASVRITPEVLQLNALGSTAQLTATAYDKNGEAISEVEFTWLTVDRGIAQVSDTGLVTAITNGATAISAKASTGQGATVPTRVQQTAATVQISPNAWSTDEAWIGARRQFSASVADANGHAIDGAAVTWSTREPTLASVDDTGLATVMGASVDAMPAVIAQSGGVSGEVPFTPRHDDADTPGYMYTAWYARTDTTPAMLVDGRLVFPMRSGCTENCTVEFYGNIPSVAGLRPIWPHPTVEKFQYEGNRIALLTDVANGAGTLRIFDRAQEMFIAALGNAIDFQLEDNRIGVLLEGGMLRTTNSISASTAGWITQRESGVVKFRLVGSYIGVLLEDGTVHVRAGHTGPWYELADSDVVDFDLLGVQAVNELRVAILRRDGLLRARDGLATSGFRDLASDVESFKLSANYIAAARATGELQAKEGLDGGWITLESVPLRQYELSGERIATLSEDGRFRARNGIFGPWRSLAETGARAIHLQGSRVGYVDDAGVLRVMTGIDGDDWLASQPQGAGVTQFRLIVDNPVPPERTTPEMYRQENLRCVDLNNTHYDPPDTNNPNPNNCYYQLVLAVPASYYGVFCGGGRPVNMPRAIQQGSINGFDEACAHHDNIEQWYAEWYDYLIFDFPTVNYRDLSGSCVVRYAIYHSRLTKDGRLLADGRSSLADWNESWSLAGMYQLWNALNYYWDLTFSCNSDNLGRFDVLTDAEND